jgi:alanine dehydrogenase
VSRSLRIISDAEACRLLVLPRAYDVILGAYRQAAIAPPVLSTPSAMLMRHPSAPGTQMKVKGAQLPERRIAGFRLVGDVHADAAEVSHDFLWLADLDTAEPVGLVEMKTMHVVRTALTGVIALEALHGTSCRTIAILGAGRIAEWLIEPLRNRLRPDEIRVAASRPARAAAFAERHGEPVFAAGSVEAAVRGADAVIAITSTETPLIHDRHLSPGMTVIGMGGGHECASSILRVSDRFFVDDFSFASVAGSLGAWLSRGEIDSDTARLRLDGELGQVVTGLMPGRRNDGERIFAIVQGMVCCDLALAGEIFDRAVKEGIGNVVAI